MQLSFSLIAFVLSAASFAAAAPTAVENTQAEARGLLPLPDVNLADYVQKRGILPLPNVNLADYVEKRGYLPLPDVDLSTFKTEKRGVLPLPDLPARWWEPKGLVASE